MATIQGGSDFGCAPLNAATIQDMVCIQINAVYSSLKKRKYRRFNYYEVAYIWNTILDSGYMHEVCIPANQQIHLVKIAYFTNLQEFLNVHYQYPSTLYQNVKSFQNLKQEKKQIAVE